MTVARTHPRDAGAPASTSNPHGDAHMLSGGFLALGGFALAAHAEPGSSDRLAGLAAGAVGTFLALGTHVMRQALDTSAPLAEAPKASVSGGAFAKIGS